MKIKDVKKFGIPSLEIKDKKAGFYFNAEIYDGGSGYFTMKTHRNLLHCREDATVEDWIDDIDNEICQLQLLKDFLEDVNYESKNSAHLKYTQS